MKLEKLTSVGLAAILSLAIAMPVLAQGNETKDYQAIKDERDQKKLKSMLEAFLNNYPKSMNRADVDLQLMPIYITNKDYAQAVKFADSPAPAQDLTDPKLKVRFFTLAMAAANNQGTAGSPKMLEFGDKILAADPENINALMSMSRTYVENLPKDAAEKDAALKKATGYAERAQKVTKPADIKDEDWKSNRSRLHDTFALIYFNQGRWADAAKEDQENLKSSPKDGPTQLRFGMATYYQMLDSALALQALNKEAREKQAKGDDVSSYMEPLTRRNKDFETQRDIAVDALGKVLALTPPNSPVAQDTHKVFDPIYKQKNNNSDDGRDAFIASKKAELDALTPLAPPMVMRGAGPGAGGPTAGGPGGPGGGPGGGGGGGRGGR